MNGRRNKPSTSAVIGKTTRRSYKHLPPQQPIIPAGRKGWWRLRHVLAFYGISESEYRAGAKVGPYRKPDEYRGRIPVWRAEKF